MLNEIISIFKKGSLFTKLIYINVAVFVPLWFVVLIFPVVSNWIAVPSTFQELLIKPWTIITYMFAHSGFLHLLFNLLWLFWFGQIFTKFLQQKQLLAVYLLGGIIGALMHLTVNQMLPPIHRAGIIGSSAAVMAIAFSVAAYKPNYTMNLVFIGEVKLKYIVAIAFFVDIMGAASSLKTGLGGIAHIAHLGGAFFGIWFGYELRKNGKDITKGFVAILDTIFTWFGSSSKNKASKFSNIKMTKPFSKKTGKPSKSKSDWEFNADKAGSQDEINRILDKISDSGYDSLTNKEKEFLFKQK